MVNVIAFALWFCIQSYWAPPISRKLATETDEPAVRVSRRISLTDDWLMIDWWACWSREQEDITDWWLTDHWLMSLLIAWAGGSHWLMIDWWLTDEAADRLSRRFPLTDDWLMIDWWAFRCREQDALTGWWLTDEPADRASRRFPRTDDWLMIDWWATRWTDVMKNVANERFFKKTAFINIKTK